MVRLTHLSSQTGEAKIRWALAWLCVACVYYGKEPCHAADLMIRDEARRIAANIAKPPKLVRAVQ